MAQQQAVDDGGYTVWLQQQGYQGDAGAGWNTGNELAAGMEHNYAGGVPAGMTDGYMDLGARGVTPHSDMELRQQYERSIQQTATNRAGVNAAQATAPGQDIFSQKLAGMAQGQFSPDDPSYQWRLQQGQQAVERSGAARGMLGSGNILTELTQYGQGMASQEYAAQFERMLKGSQNVTSQYGQAYDSLARIMNANTAEYSAEAHAGTSLGQLGLENRKQSSEEDYHAQKSAGATDALATLFNQPSQNNQTTNMQGPETYRYTAAQSQFTPVTGFGGGA